MERHADGYQCVYDGRCKGIYDIHSDKLLAKVVKGGSSLIPLTNRWVQVGFPLIVYCDMQEQR